MLVERRQTPIQIEAPDIAAQVSENAEYFLQRLNEYFGVEFSIWQQDSESFLHQAANAHISDNQIELIKVVASKKNAETIAEAGSIVRLALPFTCEYKKRFVAVADFVLADSPQKSVTQDELEHLRLSEADAVAWMAAQDPWSWRQLSRLSHAAIDSLNHRGEANRNASDIEKVSHNLASTYEEISLIYGVTKNLRISARDEEVGGLALEHLVDCIGAQSVAIQYLPVAHENETTYDARTTPQLITEGDFPLSNLDVTKLVYELGLTLGSEPFVANTNLTHDESWHFPGVDQLIIVPLSEGSNVFGWMVAVNSISGEEFGTVEASLLSSLGVMLGIHAGNRELYRQQAEFIADVVMALSSAIDAKDPYTCGHSDRVARVSVRLAKQLGADEQTLHTIYMAGLLHDIGKIGIDDRVLRKPDRLTDEEFEQIKQHPELGYAIIKDIRQLADVLPAVLHHHERVDGQGYPHGLHQDAIPWIARVMAVADAYDAMHSDRPYRKGMPDQTVDAILREGSGTQWDSSVIDAYFTVREDIRSMSSAERANLSLNVKEWA